MGEVLAWKIFFGGNDERSHFLKKTNTAGLGDRTKENKDRFEGKRKKERICLWICSSDSRISDALSKSYESDKITSLCWEVPCSSTQGQDWSL